MYLGRINNTFLRKISHYLSIISFLIHVEMNYKLLLQKLSTRQILFIQQLISIKNYFLMGNLLLPLPKCFVIDFYFI